MAGPEELNTLRQSPLQAAQARATLHLLQQVVSGKATAHCPSAASSAQSRVRSLEMGLGSLRFQPEALDNIP